MKITYKTAAPSLLLLAACLPAAAQMEINPDHYSDESSPKISVPRQVDQVRNLQGRLEDYEQQLRVKSELVEKARQDAISAGIQGDGAGSYIDVYRQQQKELEVLQAALTPQVERTSKLIASLTSSGSSEDSSVSQSPGPTRPSSTSSLSRNSRGSKQSQSKLIASRNSSELHAAGR